MADEKDNKGSDKKDAPSGPSKFPDIKELGAMAGKLFGDVKKSISEIIVDYKKNHPPQPKDAKPKAEKKADADKKPKEEASDKPSEEKEKKSDDAS